MISANSFWILLAEVERALEPKALEPRSLVFLSLSEAVAAVDEELEEDIFFFFCLNLQKYIQYKNIPIKNHFLLPASRI